MDRSDFIRNGLIATVPDHLTLVKSRIQCRGVGPQDALVAFIGEAPGTVERQRGEPFVGGSGRLLDKLITRGGLPRRTCYIDNVILEQPPKNNIKKFIDLTKKEPLVVENAAVTKQYMEYLKLKLQKVNPNVVVAVGAVALWVLCDKKGIMKWRGSILNSSLLPGKKVVPMIHPAAAMRQFIYQRVIQMDIARIVEESKSPDIELLQRPNLVLRPSFDEAMHYLNSTLAEGTMVAFDIEVVNEEVDCVSFAKGPTDVICIPFAEGGKHYFTAEHETIVVKKMAQVLENCPIIGQNLAFDATFMFQRYGIRINVVDDTMVAHGVAFPDLPKGLPFITAAYTRQPYYKDEGKKWKGVPGADEDFWRYNALDSAVVMEAWENGLKRDVGRLQLTDVYRRHVDLIRVLVYMQSRGIRVDLPRLEAKKSVCEEESDKLTYQLQQMCGYAINPNSPAQLKDYFYIKKKLPAYTRQSTEGESLITTDDTAMKRLVAKGVEEAGLVLRIRKLNKLVGTYLNAELDEDKRLRGALNPVGTKTGRLSSGKTIFGTGMNMQNLPEVMKKFLLADPEHVMYVVDMSMAEKRIMAHIAPDQVMKDAFAKGVDIHCLTAGFVFNKPWEEISDESGSCPLGNGTRSERYWGKTINYAFDYGMGANTFSLEYEIPLVQAKSLRVAYLALYTGVSRYWKWIQRELGDGLTITNVLGRRRLFLDRWGESMFRMAYDFIPQSTVADVINMRGLLHVYNNQELYKPVDLLNQEHDSIWFQLPLSMSWFEHLDILNSIRQSLETPLTWKADEFVIPADVKVGVSVGHVVKVGELKTGEMSALSLKAAYDKSREAYTNEETN